MPSHAPRSIRFISVALACAAATGLATVAHAAQQRSFVASFGSDAANCQLATPCRSFNAAIAQTLANGEVVILDTAGYGPMAINKSLKVIGPSGVYGGISVTTPGTDGITINAGDNDVVTLRGLDVAGLGGLVGINVVNAGAVHIEKSSVSNFTLNAGACVKLSTAKAIQLFVADSFLRECSTGVLVDGTVDANKPVATIDNTRIERGTNTEGGTITGVKATGNYFVNIRNSQITSGQIGVSAAAAFPTNTVAVQIVDTQITLMTTAGVVTSGTGGGAATSLTVNLQNSTINASTAALKHGFGTFRLKDNVFANVMHMLVNCGSDQFWGPSYEATNARGSNFFVDFANPGAAGIGCTTYNSPGKISAQ